MTSIRSALVAALLAASLAACGGGGTTPAPASTSAGTSAAARGTASIFIPARTTASSTRRTPLWVSPSTKSVTIQITRESDHNSTYFTAVTTPTAPNCAAATGGTVCQIPFGAPPGVDDVSIYAWDFADPGPAAPLASYAHNAVTFTAGADNSMTFTLGGIIGAPMSFAAPPTFTAGQPADFTVPLALKDRDGNAIAGPLDAPLCVVLVNAAGQNHFTVTAPAANGAGISGVGCVVPPGTGKTTPPTQPGLGVLDTSLAGSVTIHYDGTAGSNASLTIGTQSMDSAYMIPVFTTIPFAST